MMVFPVGSRWTAVLALVLIGNTTASANDGCACPGVPSCAVPGWCAPGCGCPDSGWAGGANCDDGCCPNCRSKNRWINREKGPFIQIICSKYKMPSFGCYHAPYAVVSQSMPAVITNQSAVMPVLLTTAVQTQAAPVTQAAPQNQGTTGGDLERKVDRLRADVDELADSTRRLTLILDKIDQKLTRVEATLDTKADKQPFVPAAPAAPAAPVAPVGGS